MVEDDGNPPVNAAKTAARLAQKNRGPGYDVCRQLTESQFGGAARIEPSRRIAAPASITLPFSRSKKKACPSSAAVPSCLRRASFHEIDFPDIANQISRGYGSFGKATAPMKRKNS